MADERIWCWTCERRLSADEIEEVVQNDVRMFICKTCGDVVEKPRTYEPETAE